MHNLTVYLIKKKKKGLCKACTKSDLFLFLNRSTSKKRHCALKSKHWKFTGGHRFMYFHLSVLFHMRARHINHQAAALSCNRVHKGENLRKRSSVMPVQKRLSKISASASTENVGSHLAWNDLYDTGRGELRCGARRKTRGQIPAI